MFLKALTLPVWLVTAVGINARTQPELVAADLESGVWTSTIDKTLDGRMDPEETTTLELRTANGRLIGQYEGQRAAGKSNTSVFVGQCVDGTPPLVTLRQDDALGYTAIYTGRLVGAGRVEGTYTDNRGYSGNWTLTKKSKQTPSITKDGVEVFHDVPVEILNRGSIVPMGNGHHEFVDVPAALRGRNYTKRGGYQGLVRFEVHKSQTIYLAMYGQNWGGGGNSSGNWKHEIISRELLEKQGWRPTGALRVMHSNPSYPEEPSWILFSRECEAGERFAIRNHKYQAPILIWGPQPQPASD